MNMENEIERQEREYFEAALSSSNAELAGIFRQAVETANALMPLTEAQRDKIEQDAYDEAVFSAGGADHYGSSDS